jgi:membrane-bound inhibitor of C-type lysozyme
MNVQKFFKVTCLAGMVSTLGMASADAQQRTWSVSGSGNQVSIADCSNCDEDIGMTIQCRGPGQPARVQVMYASVEQGQQGEQVPLTLKIGSREYRYVAATEFAGLIGYFPSFDLFPGDPVLRAMAASNQVRVSYKQADVGISLRGVSSAITTFNQQCGWNGSGQQLGQAPQPPAPPPPPAPPSPPQSDNQSGGHSAQGGGISSIFGQAGQGQVGQGQGVQQGQNTQGQDRQVLPIFEVLPADGADDLSWFTNDYVDDNNNRITSLTYGIPETDAVAMTIRCSVDRPQDRVTVDWLTDYGSRSPGSVVPVSVGGFSAESMAYQGRIFLDSEEYSGIRLRIARSDEIWTQMAGTNQVRLSIPGGRPQMLPTGASFRAIKDFVSACPVAQQVSTQPPVTPTQPPAPPITAQPPQLPQQPGTPQMASGTLNYLCNDGTSVTARIESMGTVMIAYVRDGAAAEVPLVSVQAPFGNRFSNGALTLHATGNTAQVESGETARFCQLK